MYYVLRPFIPYCLLKIGENWLPLNRDYKPLGLQSANFVKYEEFTHLFIPDKFVRKDLPEITFQDSPLDKQHYMFFYTDGSTPRDRKLLDRYTRLVRESFFSIPTARYRF